MWFLYIAWVLERTGVSSVGIGVCVTLTKVLFDALRVVARKLDVENR